MTDKQRQHIEGVISNGYFLSSPLSVSAGLRLYRKQFMQFALYILLIPIISLIFTLLGLGTAGLLVLMLVVSPVLSAGLYLGANKVAKSASVTMQDFFKVTQKAPQIILSNLISIIISALVLLPIYYIFEQIGMIEWYEAVALQPQDPPAPPMMNAAQSTTFFLNLIPLVYLQVGFSWAFQLILFYDAGPFEALELSRRLVTRKWGTQFMMLLTFFSMFMLASFLLAPLTGISIAMANLGTMGLFLIFPWAYCSLHIGFAQAMYTENGMEEDE